MVTSELIQLESQIDHLMHVVNTLQSENNVLRQKIAVHIQEATRLQHKNERAASQIKHVIKQMKEELS